MDVLHKIGSWGKPPQRLKSCPAIKYRPVAEPAGVKRIRMGKSFYAAENEFIPYFCDKWILEPKRGCLVRGYPCSVFFFKELHLGVCFGAPLFHSYCDIRAAIDRKRRGDVIDVLAADAFEFKELSFWKMLPRFEFQNKLPSGSGPRRTGLRSTLRMLIHNDP